MSARSRFLLGGDVFLIQFAVKQIVSCIVFVGVLCMHL